MPPYWWVSVPTTKAEDGRGLQAALVMNGGLLLPAGSQRGSRGSTGGHGESGNCVVGIPFIPDGNYGKVDDRSDSQRSVET